ncbi:hypothetical protein C8R43DRAFT_893851 [Mycena crocata]|nr:hypothetical protein C8R43DRAFT_893825 [Mycena crocata]KAJ7136534.1 hypothetical protein C8R43DRAFT_893851 [Mycena crocata]
MGAGDQESEHDVFEGGTGNRVGYNDYNTKSWTYRTNAQCRHWAEKYRRAPTNSAAQSYFDRSGLRWTEFLRLPYFDLPTMLVIDSMHNLFLGLLKEHFRNILGFRPTKSKKNSKKGHPDNLPKSSAIYIAKGLGCTDLLKKGRTRSEKNPNTDYICTKFIVEKASDPESIDQTPAPQVEAITQAEREALWADLETMIKPSWMTSVPPKFGGESSDGKLKADQWRTLGTVYMPITLIRLWCASEAGSYRRELLELTMDLVSAVILASSRVTSPSNANHCKKFLLKYRAGLNKLFPDYKCHPNHHMALHIPDFLELFGPIHGWWTFPFERLIGKLQKVRTNYKPGKIELHHKGVVHNLIWPAQGNTRPPSDEIITG